MKTSWRRLEDVFRFRLQITSSKRLQDVSVKTNTFVLFTRLQDVFKTFSRRVQDVFRRLAITFSRRLQDVFKTSSSGLQKDLSMSHFWEIYGKCAKFVRVIKISQVLVFHFTTPLAAYRGSTGLKIGFWLRISNIELTLITSLQIKPRKYSAEKYV